MQAMYHQRTLKLLGQQFDPVHNEALATWAAEHNIELSPSLEEWYRLPNAVAILRTYSNDDHPYEPQNFRLREDEDRLIVELINENQSCCGWGVSLNGSDDPPVVIELDGEWLPCADRFSTFTFTRVFDWQYYYAEQQEEENHEDWWRAAGPVTEEALDGLARLYHVGPTTFEYPGQPTQRFFSRDQRIIITEGKGHSGWSLLGATAAARNALRGWIPSFWDEVGMSYERR